jgi:hypothetical protein
MIPPKLAPLVNTKFVTAFEARDFVAPGTEQLVETDVEDRNRIRSKMDD